MMDSEAVSFVFVVGCVWLGRMGDEREVFVEFATGIRGGKMALDILVRLDGIVSYVGGVLRRIEGLTGERSKGSVALSGKDGKMGDRGPVFEGCDGSDL